MDSKHPIRESTWHVFDTKDKTKLVIDKVLIAGDNQYLRVISESEVYLRRVYERVYGKKNTPKNLDKKTLRIKRIIIHDKPDLGYGVGCHDEEVLKKYGFQ